MPVSVCKKAFANVSPLVHVKNGAHHRDIFANEDGGPHMTCGIMTVTNEGVGGVTVKVPCTGHLIVTEGELSLEDGAKPGEVSILEPGDVIRIDKGTTITWSSPTTGKAFYVGQCEFGIDAKSYMV